MRAWRELGAPLIRAQARVCGPSTNRRGAGERSETGGEHHFSERASRGEECYLRGMKKIMLSMALALIAGLALGCGDKGSDSKGSASASGKSDGNPDLDAFLKLDSEKGDAFSAGADCAAKAKTVGDWRTKHSAEYKALQKKLGSPPKDWMDKNKTKLDANKKAVMDTMAKCTGDAAFDDMMDKTKAE